MTLFLRPEQLYRQFGRRPRTSRPAGRRLSGAGWWLVAGLLCGLSNAQSNLAQSNSLAPDVALCTADEELLSVFVGGSGRGTVVVRISRDGEGSAGQISAGSVRVLLPAAVLRSAEASYIAQTLDCDGEAFVTLKPEITVRYDQASQAVRVAPALELLGNSTFDFLADPQRSTSPDAQSPSWGVTAGVEGSALYRRTDELTGAALPTTYRGSGYLAVGAAQNQLSGYLGILSSTPNGSQPAALQLRATAQYTVNPNVVIYGAWNASPASSEPGFNSSTFRGIAVAVRGGFSRVLSELVVELPVEAEVNVTVNLKSLRSFRAAAGTLRLKNIPLSNSGPSQVTIVVTDENGSREITQTVPGDYRALPAGAYLASGQVGYQDGRWGGNVNAQLGLKGGWSVRGQVAGQYSENATSFSVQARATYSGPNLNLSGDVSALRSTDAAGNVTTRALAAASVGTSLGPVRVQGFARLPLNDWQGTTLGAAASYSTRNWLYSASASSGLQARSWQASAAVTYAADPRGTLTAQADLVPGGYRIGLAANFSPAPNWRTSAQVSQASTGLQANAAVAYQIDPAQNVQVALSRDDLTAEYSLSREINARVSAGLTQASIQATGAVIFTDAGVQVKPALAQKALLVRTGIPNLRLVVGGGTSVVTDARGDALISELPVGETVSVRVDVQALPFAVTVAEVQREVVPPLSGVTVVDWRENFRAFRFVRFFWSEQEVASGTDVLIGGERVLVDDEGYGLTPSSSETLKGELRSNTSARSCRVEIMPGDERAVCTPGPAASDSEQPLQGQ